METGDVDVLLLESGFGFRDGSHKFGETILDEGGFLFESGDLRRFESPARREEGKGERSGRVRGAKTGEERKKTRRERESSPLLRITLLPLR